MVTPSDIRRFQSKAKVLNEKVRCAIEQDPRLRDEIILALWHGSLVLGRGGEVYDFDYAIFVEPEHCSELIGIAKHLSQRVERDVNELTWRKDAHFDGLGMFEAHTHWDLTEGGFPHVGVHVCSRRALEELLGPQLWESQVGFTRAIDAWIRYAVFQRNWVYEGKPIYDPHRTWAELMGLNVKLPEWLMTELTSVVREIGAYRPQQDGHTACVMGDPRGFELAAVLAYAIEGMPLGRNKRWKDDVSAMKNSLASDLLKAAKDENLQRVSELLEPQFAV